MDIREVYIWQEVWPLLLLVGWPGIRELDLNHEVEKIFFLHNFFYLVVKNKSIFAYLSEFKRPFKLVAKCCHQGVHKARQATLVSLFFLGRPTGYFYQAQWMPTLDAKIQFLFWFIVLKKVHVQDFFYPDSEWKASRKLGALNLSHMWGAATLW